MLKFPKALPFLLRHVRHVRHPPPQRVKKLLKALLFTLRQVRHLRREAGCAGQPF